jgi:hypothetical protein
LSSNDGDEEDEGWLSQGARRLRDRCVCVWTLHAAGTLILGCMCLFHARVCVGSGSEQAGVCA